MNTIASSITIPVDLTNPGQFFACCGLLELADRFWPGTEGWFEDSEFKLRFDATFEELIKNIQAISVTNTMTAKQSKRLQELSSMSKKERGATKLEEEKKALDKMRREEPIFLEFGNELRIDWFTDDYSGGSRFKTWAGQQSVLNIATAMHAGLASIEAQGEMNLWDSVYGEKLPFYFDSDLGGQGSPRDVGFSFDALKDGAFSRIEGSYRPVLEFLAFIGLQRYRPREIRRKTGSIYVYGVWSEPLPPFSAAPVVCQALPFGSAQYYEFRLLYRTKYLKSFLPAIPFQGEENE